jgi:hypothetical protein
MVAQGQGVMARNTETRKEKGFKRRSNPFRHRYLSSWDAKLAMDTALIPTRLGLQHRLHQRRMCLASGFGPPCDLVVNPMRSPVFSRSLISYNYCPLIGRRLPADHLELRYHCKEGFLSREVLRNLCVSSTGQSKLEDVFHRSACAHFICCYCGSTLQGRGHENVLWRLTSKRMILAREERTLLHSRDRHSDAPVLFITCYRAQCMLWHAKVSPRNMHCLSCLSFFCLQRPCDNRLSVGAGAEWRMTWFRKNDGSSCMGNMECFRG